MDATQLETFKAQQKAAWSTFAPTEIYTCQVAARLVPFAGIRSGDDVLDVGCGTGVVSLVAARQGARVTGLDLTPELVAHARENAAIGRSEIRFLEGDAEALPFEDASFDVVVSQFGHMFAPRPDVTTREMLRVLRPGGTIAFATWPPHLFVGQMFALVARTLPPPPGAAPVWAWGDPAVVRERLGAAVEQLVFDGGIMRMTNLGPAHYCRFMERNIGPVMRIVDRFADKPTELAAFRAELDALVDRYFDHVESAVRHEYLLTRARKTR